jgi:trk system potassium uptake protein TrkH
MEFLGRQPSQKVALYFFLLIMTGALVLTLPISSGERDIRFVDALFTSTSAVCVTGLTTVDTGRDYSFFGQVVILILIQLGGLGVMTFASALLLTIGTRLAFRERYGLSQTLASDTGVPTMSLLRAVLAATLGIELMGAIVLFVRFRTELPLGEAVFASIFHSVSAFCNAGFSIFSNNLEGHRTDVAVLLTIGALIVSGGLGFVVMREIVMKFRVHHTRISLHSKLCITVTLILIFGGAAAIYAVDRTHAFASDSVAVGITNALFQSITSRTAGFNSVPQASLTDLSILVTLILMFIGGCPGSTAGGVKTTTMAVVALLVYRRFRGWRAVTAFRSSISPDSIAGALTVLLLAILILAIGLVAFLTVQTPPGTYRVVHGWIMESLFELVSAFGTVGLSMGMTPYLETSGKLVLIALMYTGRVGLLTLALVLARPTRPGEVAYLEEEVMVG